MAFLKVFYAQIEIGGGGFFLIGDWELVCIFVIGIRKKHCNFAPKQLCFTKRKPSYSTHQGTTISILSLTSLREISVVYRIFCLVRKAKSKR